MKKKYRILFTLALCAALVMIMTTTAFASVADPLESVNKLSDFVFAAIKAVGIIILGFGVLQLGLSLKSHDPAQRAQGVLALFGGIVIVFAKNIIDMIT